MNLSVLPEAVEDIVHKYHHQVKYSSVMDELMFVSKTLQQKCGRCRETFVSFDRCECINHDVCSATFCGECQKLDVRREYEDFMMDATEHQIRHLDMEDFYDEIVENMECNHCISMAFQFQHETEEYDDGYYGDDHTDRYSYYSGW